VSKCTVKGCDGVAAPPGQCLGHLDNAHFEETIAQLRRSNAWVDGRGARFTEVRATQLVNRLRAADHALRLAVDLRGAVFDGDLTLSDVSLEMPVRLAGATVAGELRVEGVQGLPFLSLGAPAEPRTWVASLHVERCVDDTADWTIAELDVGGTAHFRRNELRSLSLDRCSLGTLFLLSELELAGGLALQACVWGEGQFEHVHTAGDVTCTASMMRRLHMRSCRFDAWTDLFVVGSITAARCSFGGPTRIRLEELANVTLMLREEGPRRDVPHDPNRPAREQLELESVRFESAAYLRWGRGPVLLPATLFAATSTLDQAAESSEAPRLINVSEMDGANLRIGSVGLDDTRLSAAATLGPIDSTRLRFGRGAAGITRRRYVADEDEHPPRRWSSEARVKRRNNAHVLSETYRDLRKSSEDVGSYAAANDLYYGERLWKRKAVRPLGIQWLWLTAYSLVGYGVRPWRPAVLLGLTLVLGTVAFGTDDALTRERVLAATPREPPDAVCERNAEPTAIAERQRVACPADFSERLEFSIRTSTSLIRPAAGYETRGVGVGVDIAVRLFSALFFATFVLAMRNRVRR
jgi:hypothetical protein